LSKTFDILVLILYNTTMKNSFVVIETGGKQYIAEEGKTLVVDHLQAPEKETVTFDKVLLYAKDDDTVFIGKPYLPGAKVTAEIVKQDKGEKIRIARFRAKSRYRKVTGFRALLTEVKVVKIKVSNA